MTKITYDPEHPGLKRGEPDETPVPQNDVYLALASGNFVRPIRYSYVHVGVPAPRFSLRDLTDDERRTYNDGGDEDYVKYEEYPKGEAAVGRFWTQKDLDLIGKGCGTRTTMGRELAETYAMQPSFYGATYCCGCMKHRPVGERGEFVWDGSDQRVGT